MRTPTHQQGLIIPSTPCTPRTLASFDFEKSQADRILSRTHTITSLGHLLEFAVEWFAVNGQPTNSTEYGLLLKAFDKTDVISLILSKIDIFVAWRADVLDPRWKRLARHVGGEQIEGCWPFPRSRRYPRRHRGRYSIRHRRPPCTHLHYHERKSFMSFFFAFVLVQTFAGLCHVRSTFYGESADGCCRKRADVVVLSIVTSCSRWSVRIHDTVLRIGESSTKNRSLIPSFLELVVYRAQQIIISPTSGPVSLKKLWLTRRT